MALKFSKRQWLILIVYCVANILSGFCVSLQGPIYPMVAESKGATPSQYGFVFGAYSLAVFFVSPLCGKMMIKLGAANVNLLGLLITGITSIMFGFVDKINGTVLFISISVIIRIFEGLGCAMVRNAGIATVSCEFSERLEICFSIVNISFIIGNMIGPVIGGALYELGGFYLPFVLIGVLLVSTTFLVIFLPKDYPKQEENFSKGIVKFLRLPLVILGIFNVFGAFLNFLFITSVLEPHIKSLNISKLYVGLMFLCHTIVVPVSSAFWSLLCEKYDNPLIISALSSLITICGLLLLGPAPYLFIDLNLYTCIFGLFIHGIGVNGEIICGYSLFNKGASLAGLPKNIETSGFVSTTYTSSLALGSFIGPLIGGYLFETFGFPWGSHLFILYHLILCLVLIIYRFCFFGSCKQQLRDNTELEPLGEKVTKYNSFE